MEEKVLRKNKNGMAVLILGIILYLIAAALIVFGSVWMAEEEMVLGVILFVVGTVYACVGWIPFLGLKVLKPQEALVLTLFGKYVGTLKEPGFYHVNPFCIAVNPAAHTKLNQSGDVDGGMNKKLLQRVRCFRHNGFFRGQEDFPEDHDAEQQQTEDQRLSGQSGGDRHCSDVAGDGHGQSGFLMWTITRNTFPCSVTAPFGILCGFIPYDVADECGHHRGRPGRRGQPAGLQ